MKLPKKTNKPKKTTLKRKCDSMFSKFIRSLDHCEKDGERNNLQTAHIYSRRYVNMRYDENNVLCLCARCHRWAHDNPLEFSAWFNNAYPERYEYLRKKRQIIKKWTIEDYQKVIKKLENLL